MRRHEKKKTRRLLEINFIIDRFSFKITHLGSDLEIPVFGQRTGLKSIRR